MPPASAAAVAAREHEVSAALRPLQTAGGGPGPRTLYRLCKLEAGGRSRSFATLEDIEHLAGVLTPELIADVAGPALSLSETEPDSPEHSGGGHAGAAQRPLGAPASYQKPGGPCDHCGAVGARPRCLPFPITAVCVA